MSIRAPGEECLTNTQRTQRQQQARFRDKEGLPQTITGAQVSKDDPLRSVKTQPVSGSDTRQQTAKSYGSPFSQSLDVTV